MLIVKLQGGIGNQLFQYATGLALADKTNTPLWLDIYHLAASRLAVREETPRNYALNPYAITANIIQPSTDSLLRFLPARLQKFTWNYLHYLQYSHKFGEHFSTEDIAELLTNGQSVLLEGVFQEEKYFSAIRQKLVQQIRLSRPLSEEYRKYADQISNTLSVSVHIRRGDYAEREKTKAFHGLLADTYYLEALQKMQELITDATFYFFSDDMTWTKATFGHIDQAVFIDPVYPNPHADLALMCQCRHQVIANSSFSWWGAWLNEHPDKVVIAPLKWFAVKEANNQFTLPTDWLRI